MHAYICTLGVAILDVLNTHAFTNTYVSQCIILSLHVKNDDIF